MPPPAALVERVADRVRGARSILFLTGAGVSADCGLPTYRGVGGLYESDRTEDGIPIEAALSAEVFAIRPEITWKYLRRIEEACRGTKPGRGHEVMAAMGGRIDRTWVFTQNVDGLHRAAGTKRLVEIHGDAHRLRCTVCEWTAHVDGYEDLSALPRCSRCNAIIRPDVVLFGEMLPNDAVATMRRETETGFDVVFAVGTTAAFPYIVWPVLDARRRGSLTVEVNPGRTALSDEVDVRLEAKAGEALDAIWRAL